MLKPLDQYDKDSIIAEEVFVEIFEQEDEIKKAQMLLTLQDVARGLGVKTKFDIMVAAFKKVEKETMAKQKQAVSHGLVDNWTNFATGGKYDNMKCGPWIASDNGVTTYNRDSFNEVVACYHPILPIERLKNVESGEEQLKIAYKRNHKWREIMVPKELVSSANKIIALSKFGISVTSENARLLVKYLADVENLNDDDIPIQESTSKLGWIGEGFVPYDTDIVFDGDQQFKYIYESIRCHGKKREWMDHVKQLRRSGRIEVKFFLAASFASVLVGLLGGLPFIVDLWGETEGGKSVAMMLAASIWANPDASQYIGDFKTTDVALEIKSDLLNHLPLMLDDSSKTSARIRDNFEGVVYDLCSGKGKSRSNRDLGVRKESRWKNTILTNGERPLSSYVSLGGAINRILEVECRENVFKDPQYTAELLKRNYGHAGKQFVEIIKKLGADKVRRIQSEIQKEIFNDDKMQKQSIALSTILAADKIATEYLFCDGEYIKYEDAKHVLVDRNELSEHERCYRYLIDKIGMNNSRFDATTLNEKWGIIEDGHAIMYNQAFKELCESGGFSAKSFLSWADRNGVIVTQNGQLTKVKKINGKSSRCIWLKLNEFADSDGFISTEIDEEEDVPFR